LDNPTQPGLTGLTLLVQSEQQPNWDWLAGLSRYLWPDCGSNPALKAFDPSFSSGQRFYFRLRANPTVKRNNKRWGLYQEVQQRNWLARKAEQSGFALLGMIVTAEGRVGGKIHRSTGESHNLNLLAVRFEGLLQVTDPVNFLETLRQGIGSGKGLGFGLLSLAQG
jgi:CRISPR system Cascade subunit CasE